jgi:hypothetical protein
VVRRRSSRATTVRGSGRETTCSEQPAWAFAGANETAAASASSDAVEIRIKSPRARELISWLPLSVVARSVENRTSANVPLRSTFMTNLPVSSVHRNHSITLALTGVLMAIGASGCGGRRAEGFERFIPPSATARVALTAVLDAWREGRPPEEGVGPKRNVHVVDKQRKSGQRLARYEILGEVIANKGRGFAVRLSFENPEEQPVVRFLVVGIEPLWVFRQEDFEMISHWMHPMDEEKPKEP